MVTEGETEGQRSLLLKTTELVHNITYCPAYHMLPCREPVAEKKAII